MLLFISLVIALIWFVLVFPPGAWSLVFVRIGWALILLWAVAGSLVRTILRGAVSTLLLP